jgi:glycosyltransferase involved in cell wall biosynthesis
VPDDCGLLFAPETGASTVADRLEAFIQDPARYRALQRRVREQPSTFTWDRVIQQFEAIWADSDQYSYAARVSSAHQ